MPLVFPSHVRRSLAALAVSVSAFGALFSGAFASGCGSSASADSTSDGSAEAEGSPLEGGNDAGVDTGTDAKVEGGAPRFCATLVPAPRFCDDFEDGDLENDWDVATKFGTSEGSLDTTRARLSAASFHVAAPALATNMDFGNVHLRRTLISPAPHLTLSFWAFYPKVTIDKGLLAIATVNVTLTHQFVIYLRDDDATTPGPAFQEIANSITTRHGLTKLPTAGAWTHVELSLDLDLGTATLSFDGDKALDAIPITAETTSEATIRLGAVFATGPSDAFEANYDDVVLDF